MSSNPTIVVRELGKRFDIFERPSDRLKQLLFGKGYSREFWALRDVSFELYPGQTLGVLGRNGAGKSTLLQLICGTLTPTVGEVSVKGRISALLELGSGFNSELTGLENIYVYSAIMGLTQAEVDQRLDSILAFADIGSFISLPVKTYSSGMFVRLAFAVAIHVDPEVMIVDEALAVGDMHFQQKCFKKLKALREAGMTMLFVSHDIEMVKRICNKAIVLHDGKSVFSGEPGRVASWFVSLISADFDLKKVDEAESNKETITPDSAEATHRFGDGTGRISEVSVLESKTKSPSVAEIERPVTIRVQAEFFEDRDEYVIGFIIKDKLGVNLIALNNVQEKIILPLAKNGDRVEVDFKFDMLLAPGDYSVTVALAYSQHEMKWMDWIDNALMLKVVDHDFRRIVSGLVLPPERKSCFTLNRLDAP